jgi:hypothetical protein
MASIYQEFLLDVSPRQAWDVVRDVGAVHARLFPGYLVDTRLEDGGPEEGGPVAVRVVTFASGLVARERILAVDEEHRRVAWSAAGGSLAYHHASMHVLPESAAGGAERTRLVWITDVLPDAMAPAVRALVEGGAAVLRRTLAPRPTED